MLRNKIIISALAIMPLSITFSCSQGENKALPGKFDGDVKTFYEFKNQPREAFEEVRGASILNPSLYNQFKHFKGFEKEHDVEVVVISGKNIFLEVAHVNKERTKIIDILQSLKNLKFDFYNPGIGMGEWVKTFKHKNKSGVWSGSEHGFSKNKNYGDYYPIYFMDHKFAQLGVSNLSVKPGDVIEITYNHNS